jgi:hypothetical protein
MLTNSLYLDHIFITGSILQPYITVIYSSFLRSQESNKYRTTIEEVSNNYRTTTGHISPQFILSYMEKTLRIQAYEQYGFTADVT